MVVRNLKSTALPATSIAAAGAFNQKPQDSVHQMYKRGLIRETVDDSFSSEVLPTKVQGYSSL